MIIIFYEKQEGTKDNTRYIVVSELYKWKKIHQIVLLIVAVDIEILF